MPPYREWLCDNYKWFDQTPPSPIIERITIIEDFFFFFLILIESTSLEVIECGAMKGGKGMFFFSRFFYVLSRFNPWIIYVRKREREREMSFLIVIRWLHRRRKERFGKTLRIRRRNSLARKARRNISVTLIRLSIAVVA